MIDTRNKILTLEQATKLAANEGMQVVTGYCDPILPGYVRRLRETAGEGRLLLVLKTPHDEFLDARARAELAASLRIVQAVVIADEWDGAIPLHEEEAQTRQAFIDYVCERAVPKG